MISLKHSRVMPSDVDAKKRALVTLLKRLARKYNLNLDLVREASDAHYCFLLSEKRTPTLFQNGRPKFHSGAPKVLQKIAQQFFQDVAVSNSNNF